MIATQNQTRHSVCATVPANLNLTRQPDSVHEAFGAPYQLPNRTVYNETCANIGGSWIVKRELVLNENCNEITARAAAVRRIADEARTSPSTRRNHV